jgi:hypothetical protein
MLASLYERCFLHRSQVATCAGDLSASWQAIASGRHALQRDADGWWVGQLADRRPPSEHLLEACLASARDEPAGGLCAANSKPIAAPWPPERLWDHQPSALSGIIARRLGWRHWTGVPTVAACSTGLHLLLAAADWLTARDQQQPAGALVATMDAPLQPLLLAGYRSLGVACRSAAPPTAMVPHPVGFAPAEGVATTWLATNPASWRLIAGVRLADASHPTRCDDLAVAVRCLSTLWQAGPAPDAIITHGTGTAAGDAYETAALERGPWRECPRIIAKPVIGHCLGASGLAELLAATAGPYQVLWKLSFGFHGHVAAVCCVRDG